MKAKHEQCAAVLREHGGRHSLLYVAAEGMLEEIAAGIAAGDDVNARDGEQRTPLHLSAEKGHSAALKVLIEAGTDLTACDKV